MATGAFVAGLVGSPHCALMCGPLAAAGGRGAWAWHVGKLGAYALLGALAGAVGRGIGGPSWLPLALAAAVLIAATARMFLPAGPAAALGALARHLPPVSTLAGRLAFGALAALLPCGILYAALALPIAGGSAAAGAASMLAFGLGTVPSVALAGGGLGLLGRWPRGRRVAAALVLGLGLWSIAGRADESPLPVHVCHPRSP